MSKIIDNLYYTESHEWVKIDGEFAYIGITDFSQNQLGEIKYIDAGEKSKEINKGDEFGSIESTKATSDLLAPLSGTIEETNKEVGNNPNSINKDPYTHWIVKIKLSNQSEIQSLMDHIAYKAYIENK